jgi:hypothetical protein
LNDGYKSRHPSFIESLIAVECRMWIPRATFVAALKVAQNNICNLHAFVFEGFLKVFKTS